MTEPAAKPRHRAQRRRVQLRRQRGHERVRRPHPPRDLPLRPRAGADGVTAGEVAEHFDLHPNVARHHLEKLTGRRLPRRRARLADADARAGRRSATAPARSTRPSRFPPQARRPARRRSWRARSTRSAPTRPRPSPTRSASSTASPSPPACARDGRPTDGHRSVRAALGAVADALTAHGFAAHTEAQRRLAHDRVGVLPVRRHRAAVPARRVRARPRHDPRHARRPLRRDVARSSRRAVPTATTTASRASDARSCGARTSTTHRPRRCARPRSRRCCRSCATTTPIPGGSTPKDA